MRERRWRTLALLAAGVAIGPVFIGTPAGAHVAGWTHNWTAHIRPKADARYYTKTAANARFVPKSVLTTIQGDYAAGGQAAVSGHPVYADIPFGFQLASAPTPHYIPVGGPAVPQCPGNVANPTAAAGHLCLYEGSANAVLSLTFLDPSHGVGGTSRWGAIVLLRSSVSSGQFWSVGTWAVTAPSGTVVTRN
jgi:hypothetical protein